MAYRSWLKDVRKINDLGSHLFHFPKNKETWPRMDEYENRRIELNRKRPLPVDPGSERLFACRLKWGHIIDVKREKDRVEIHLYDAEAHSFVLEYCEIKGIEVVDCRALVVLVFEGVNYSNSMYPDPEGWLKHADFTKWRSDLDFNSADQLFYDWFFEQDDHIQWVGEFMKFDQRHPTRWQDSYLVIDCNRVYGRDQRTKIIEKSIGLECANLWDEFQNLLWDEELHLSQRFEFLESRLTAISS